MAAKQKQSSANGSHAEVDGMSLIEHQHQELRKKITALSKFEANEEMVGNLRKLAHAWAGLVSLKDDFLYPALRDAQIDEDLLQQTEIQNDLTTVLLSDLVRRPMQDPLFRAELKVLLKQMRQAISNEEKKGSGLIAKARKSGLDTKELGQKMKDPATQMEDMAEDMSPDLSPRYLRSAGTYGAKETTSMRSNERERDDRGRFVDDDENRGSRSRGRSTGGYRSQDEGRGWHGDSRGHSQASRRGWEERRGSGGGRYDDDDDYGSRGRSSGGGGGGRRSGGWFGDSEGHSEASRRGWDSPSHGDSGWFGDREGHSQASRRGWENPDHGDSGWFGDREGHSQASRRGWENSDHGESGWFGDPEGHSEASRRGWERRGSSRHEDDDDDYRDRRRSSRRR